MDAVEFELFMLDYLMATFTKRLFTVDQYLRMVEARILAEDDRVELLNGEIVEMSPIGVWHDSMVGLLNYLLLPLLQEQAYVRIQGGIQLDQHNQLLPDVSVLKQRTDFYRHHQATAADVLLIIEVADSTLDKDQHEKIPLYAQCGIPEVWIVNGRDDQIEQYTQPSATGYQSVKKYKAGETITSQQLPQIQLAVDQFVN
jgi:Uma2 family endonuclease